MRRTFLGLALGSVLLLATRSEAELRSIDPVPAATLLLPYFEVDLDNPQGITTLMSINNASATAVLAHVTLWSDLAVPTLSFDVYLTGYDVQTINLRDILVGGTLPQTASDGQDFADTISPQGPFSQDINFASCNPVRLDDHDPNTPDPRDPNDVVGLPPLPLSSAFVAHLQAAHTGMDSPSTGQCYGRSLRDRLARGYVTVDTVSRCTGPLEDPTTPEYFLGTTTTQNLLWGDYLLIDPGANLAQGDRLVGIEVGSGVGVMAGSSTPPYPDPNGMDDLDADDPNDPNDPVDPAYTFYGRYTHGPGEPPTGIDHREPLATVWAVEYVNDRTDLFYWRDSGMAQGPFPCNEPPPELDHHLILAFDWQENPEGLAFGVPAGLPAAAGRVRVGTTGDLPFTAKLGWLYLNLNTDNGGDHGAFKQSYVSALGSVDPGAFSSGTSAFALDNASRPADVLLCSPGLSPTYSASIDPGTTDIGNHDDDLITSVALPFPYAFLGTTYTSVNVSTNGNLQFASSDPTPDNSCPSNPDNPSTTVLDGSIFPFWDDLTTTDPNDGIYTSTTGTAPDRTFNVEWRAHVKASGEPVSFAVRLPENPARSFEIVYGNNSAASVGGATAGFRKDAGLQQIIQCDWFYASPLRNRKYTFSTCASAY